MLLILNIKTRNKKMEDLKASSGKYLYFQRFFIWGFIPVVSHFFISNLVSSVFFEFSLIIFDSWDLNFPKFPSMLVTLLISGTGSSFSSAIC